jgi:hypothetical protein
MVQSVVPQKDKKVTAAFAALGNNHNEKLFAEKFKELYPSDWERIKKVYVDHERKDKKGKGHPMPEPDKYLSNMYKVYINKNK